jgi:hypothetical protein
VKCDERNHLVVLKRRKRLCVLSNRLCDWLAHVPQMSEFRAAAIPKQAEWGSMWCASAMNGSYCAGCMLRSPTWGQWSLCSAELWTPKDSAQRMPQTAERGGQLSVAFVLGAYAMGIADFTKNTTGDDWLWSRNIAGRSEGALHRGNSAVQKRVDTRAKHIALCVVQQGAQSLSMNATNFKSVLAMCQEAL